MSGLAGRSPGLRRALGPSPAGSAAAGSAPPGSATPGAAGRPSTDRARMLTAGALTVFILLTLVAVAVNGLFLSRELVFLWLMAGLLAVSLSDLGGFFRNFVADWLPFFAALSVYDLLRGRADDLFAAHVFPQIEADRFLFGGEAPTVWMQERLFDPLAPQWYDFAAWAVYLTHFFAVFMVAAYLWRRARPRFVRFRNMLLTLTAAAFVTYLLFPAVPPWLASDAGALGESQRIVGSVWEHLGVSPAAAIWHKGSGFSNEVAAIPSLHTAYPVLILLFFWRDGSRRLRGLCLAYAVAMSLTLVYTAEHYVIDVVLGWAYAGAAYLAVDRVGAWRRRSEAEAPSRGALEAPADAS